MTPERFRRIREVLARRQGSLTLLMENIHKPHNVAAMLRSCDAVGVQYVHAVAAADRVALGHDSAGGSRRWLEVITHRDLASAYAHLRAAGFTILVAHLSPKARDFREIDYTRATAIVMGTELFGPTPEAVAAADGAVMIPMRGMVESLNVSVAAATLLFEAERQRRAAGLYERGELDEAEQQRLLFEWAWPQVAALCRRRGCDYPELDDEGNIVGSFPR